MNKKIYVWTFTYKLYISSSFFFYEVKIVQKS